MAALESISEPDSDRRTRLLRRSPLEHYDTSPLRKVTLERWRAVLARIGAPPHRDDVASLDDVVQTLTAPDLSQQLQELLHALNDLGTPAGAQAIHDAGILLGIDRLGWPEAVEDLAVEVWSRGLNELSYERVLQFAEIAIHDRETDRRCREFTGAAQGLLSCTPRKVEQLSETLRAWFVKEAMGSAVTIRVHEEPDRHVFCISHGARVQSESTVNDDGHEAVLSFRPLTCDVVSYEHESGQLRISARTVAMVDAYRSAMGTVFFAGSAHFTNLPIYTLGPIVEAIETGAMPQAPFDFDIRSVALMSCVWNTADGVVHRLYGRGGVDCVAQARRANFQPERDEITQATLAFFFQGPRRVERVDVVVREGNRLDCRKPIHRDAIDAYLEQIGVKRAALRAAGPREVSRLTGVQSAARWKQALGDDLRAAVDSRILVYAQRPAVSTASAELAGALPIVQSLNDGSALAIDDGSLVIVGPEMLAGYELDGQRLGELLREELRCERSLVTLPLQGVYDLGPATIGTKRIRPFLVTRFVDDPPAFERLLRSHTSTQEEMVTIHLPHTKLDRWTCAASLNGLGLPFRVRRDVIRVLRLENDVPVVELVGDERLVVDLRNHVAWLDGVLLELTDGEMTTLEVLARAVKHGGSVSASNLSTMVGGPRAGPDVAKQRISALRKAIRETVGKRDANVVKNAGRGEGYRLGVPVFIVGP